MRRLWLVIASQAKLCIALMERNPPYLARRTAAARVGWAAKPNTLDCELCTLAAGACVGCVGLGWASFYSAQLRVFNRGLSRFNPSDLPVDFESERVVTTPSYDQVRRPIDKKQVARWKNYESHLGPLIAALGPGSRGNP